MGAADQPMACVLRRGSLPHRSPITSDCKLETVPRKRHGERCNGGSVPRLSPSLATAMADEMASCRQHGSEESMPSLTTSRQTRLTKAFRSCWTRSPPSPEARKCKRSLAVALGSAKRSTPVKSAARAGIKEVPEERPTTLDALVSFFWLHRDYPVGLLDECDHLLRQETTCNMLKVAQWRSTRRGARCEAVGAERAVSGRRQPPISGIHPTHAVLCSATICARSC